MTRPPFPAVLDSTIVGSFRSCRQKAYQEYVQHWKPKSPSIHLHAGGAYAKGMEEARKAFYVDQASEPDAIAAGMKALVEAYGSFECPADSAKSLERMMGAFEYYFVMYPMASDKAIPVTMPGGARGIEFSFAEPLFWEDGSPVIHPNTGDPLMYCGRMDMMANYAGAMFGYDDKTTSSLGASWSKQWDLRSQFTGYCWGAKAAGFPLQGFLVRGVSILKTKYDTQQAITYRPQWMIDRWYTQLLRDIRAMMTAWESGYWDYDLDHACTEFGGCIFRRVCLSDNPTLWLEQDFEHRVWNPLTRVEGAPK